MRARRQHRQNGLQVDLLDHHLDAVHVGRREHLFERELANLGNKAQIVKGAHHKAPLDAVELVNKASSTLAARVLKNLLRRALFVDNSLVKVENAVRDGASQAHLVRNDEHRHALLRELFNDGQNLAHHRGVKCACGLVEQDHLGFHGKRAHDGHALLLPTRELVGHTVFLVGEAHRTQQFHATLVGLGSREP